MKTTQKMTKGLLLISFLIILLVTSSCGNTEIENDKTDSLPPAGDISLLTGEESNTVLQDENNITMITDTNGPRKYYGEDYDGDTILYQEKGKILAEGNVTGTFVEIQRGDYLHLILVDEQGWYHSFWIMFDDQKLMDEYWEGKQPDPGQKISVHWIRTREYLYEARREVVMYKMTKLETLDK